MKIALSGSSGKMGQLITKVANELGHEIVSKVNRSTMAYDFGRTKPDICIDFSAPIATIKLCAAAAACKIPVLIGTTGLADEDFHKIEDFSKVIPILTSPNFSVGIHVLRKLVREATKILPKNFDIEIVEKHHTQKKDAPSGTALSILSDIKNIRKDSIETFGRCGKSEHVPGSIGVHALRGGDVVGEHDVYFFSQGERLEIAHRATNREIFARGALFVAEKFYKVNVPKLYSLEEVL
ncbi:MAG: 4-hydroxy-tetrahydrodipicolinate reductase [Puniceicoccales bacterium]|nr:4-hydroxy-tetrahydrodipicolinate reductase [Puniceicoccales bacterium]